MLFNEVLFPRKRSPFPKRGRHSLSPSERVTHSAERGPLSPLGRVARSAERGLPSPFGEGGGTADGRGLPSPSGKVAGKVAAQPTEEVRFPFYFYFNSATIATIIETIEVNAANSPNI